MFGKLKLPGAALPENEAEAAPVFGKLGAAAAHAIRHVEPRTNKLNGRTLNILKGSEGHASQVYTILNPNKSKYGIRKIAEKQPSKNMKTQLNDGTISLDNINYRISDHLEPTSRKIYLETQKEASVYKQLKDKDGSAKFLLPFLHSDSNGIRTVYIDFEYVKGYDLYSYLSKAEHIGNTEIFMEAMREIVTALLWLLDQGYLHGDINNGNFYFDETSGNWKVIDLGMATKYFSQQNIGTEFTKFYEMLDSFKESYPDGVSKLKPLFPRENTIEALTDFYNKILAMKGGKRKAKKTRKHKKRKHKTTRRL